MSKNSKRRIATIAAGSATAVIAGATAGMGAAVAAPAAPAVGQSAGSQVSATSSGLSSQARLSHGRASLAAKGQHVAAAKVALAKKKKKKRSRMS